MNYYKLEKIQDALRLDYDARKISVGPKPRVEVWSRVVDGTECTVAIAWQHGEEILSEEELLGAAEGLHIEPAEALVRNVKDREGLWLGPTPPERKA